LAGATVIVLSRRRNAAQLTKLAKNYKKRLFHYSCDVSKYDEVKVAFKKIKREVGIIYGLVNNAGVNPSRNSVDKTKKTDLEKTIAVNLAGSFYCSQFAIKSMLDSEIGGAIIMVSSIAAINGMEKRASYSVSKAGLVGLTQSIAADYSKNNIRVFCLCPGYVKTSLTLPYFKSMNDNEYSQLLKKHKLGRFGETADISNISLFLLSDSSSWMTGCVIPIDGGYSV